MEDMEQKKKQKINWALWVALAFLIGITLDSFSAFQGECRQLQQEVLRLHILANSDSPEDQALKLKVRDRILAETGALFNTAEDLSDAQGKAQASLSQVEEIARQVLAEEGCDAPVSARVARLFFDTRVYEGFTMPAGRYSALQVTIGEGKGHNWWCVLYPPLCLAAAEKLPEAMEGFSQEEQRLLESKTEYEVRFFLVELAEKFGEWIGSLKK